MMLDYLQEMSRAGPAGRRSQRRRAEPSRVNEKESPPTGEGKDEGKSIFYFDCRGGFYFVLLLA